MQTIILLEDDYDIRELVKIILEEENYQVIAFSSIKEFSNRGKDIKADLFLLDVKLPDGSGIEVCEAIMSVEQTPIIIMSAHATLQTISKTCVPNDFIEKPFDIQSLTDRIRAQLPLEG
ncbi:response regulator transcription factor [Pedobacter aquatilis]|uniref:response regulator transcription factor n=1 Tax=Pedobacter aquatilis TaxID=351343 RepID=UPI0029304EE9|nr:response regulator [Pedobacter aquatilis]